jgi:Trk K+ transport system NAD-binding subunit
VAVRKSPSTRRPSALRIWLRYVRHLLWEFRWSLGVFWGLVFAGGLVLHFGYHDHHLSYPEACYAVFMLIFLEPYLDFPEEWYLQPLFFLLPVIGLGAVADSLVRLAYLIFSRKNRLPEWQRMVASLHRDHTIVVGIGPVGYQIVQGLAELHEPVVAVQREEARDPALLETIVDSGVPLIRGDGRAVKTLEQAGVRKARAIILATSDDLTNLDAGLTARDLNPAIRVVLRLFDESLASKVHGAFAMPAISTARVSAPAFIRAATGRRIYQDFELGGRHLHLVDLTIADGSRLAGRTVGEVQATVGVNVVMHLGPDGPNVNPGHDLVFRAGDELLAIAPIDRLCALEAENRPGAVGAGGRAVAP